jgi:hypothetical protein
MNTTTSFTLPPQRTFLLTYILPESFRRQSKNNPLVAHITCLHAEFRRAETIHSHQILLVTQYCTCGHFAHWSRYHPKGMQFCHKYTTNMQCGTMTFYVSLLSIEEIDAFLRMMLVVCTLERK